MIVSRIKADKLKYRRRIMMKEKTVVCIGIFLILAVLTSCALFYSTNSYHALGQTDRHTAGSTLLPGSVSERLTGADVLTFHAADVIE